MFSTPSRVTWLPIISNGALAALKLATAVVIGSVSVLSDGLDTSVDVLSAFIAFVGIRVAERPPDEEHPYGHGNAEYISGLAESILILGGGGFIVFQAINRIIRPIELEQVELGIAVLVVSLLVNTGVSFQLYRVARRHESVALEAAAKHRASDMLTSFGVLAGLVVVALTGLNVLDPIIAIGVASVIFWAGGSIAWKSLRGLMNPRLAEIEEEELASLIGSDIDVLEVKRLHTGQVGAYRRIDATVTMCRRLSVADAHDICDRIEEDVMRRFSECSITIHVEPCDDQAHKCGGEHLMERR